MRCQMEKKKDSSKDEETPAQKLKNAEEKSGVKVVKKGDVGGPGERDRKDAGH